MKKVLKWVGIVFVILIIIGVVSSSGGNKDENSGGNDKTKDTTSSTPKEQVFKVGEEVVVGKLTYKVNKVEKTQQVGDQYLNKKANGVFLVINVTVINKDKEARMIDTNMFKLAQGETKYDPSSEASIYANNDNQFFLQNVNPNISATGDVIFDIPADANGLKLIVQNNFFGTSEKKIDLGI